VISTMRLRQSVAIPSSIGELVLCDLRDRAVAFVARQTDRYFGPPVEWTDIVRGTGTTTLVLPEQASDDHPIHVTEEGVAFTGFTVRHRDTVSVLARADRWTLGVEYAVTYTRGYVEDAGPFDIEQLVVALVGLWAGQIGSAGLSSETMGGYSYSRPAIHAFADGDMRSIPGAVRTLEAWKAPVWA